MSEVDRMHSPIPTVILERNRTRFGFAVNGGLRKSKRIVQSELMTTSFDTETMDRRYHPLFADVLKAAKVRRLDGKPSNLI